MKTALMAALALSLAVPSRAAEEKAPAPVAVVKSALCTAISDREPMDPQPSPARFETRMRRIYYWNALTAVKPPRTVRHVWKRDGKTVSDVKLKVKHARSRMWSHAAAERGDWTVDVVGEDGHVLAQAKFTVR